MRDCLPPCQVVGVWKGPQCGPGNYGRRPVPDAWVRRHYLERVTSALWEDTSCRRRGQGLFSENEDSAREEVRCQEW